MLIELYIGASQKTDGIRDEVIMERVSLFKVDCYWETI